MNAPQPNQNALATPSRCAAAVFSDESEVRKHMDWMQKERDAFGKWWEEFNLEDCLHVEDQRLAWDAWRASVRVTR